MKLPIWVWDSKEGRYLVLPTGMQYFKDGKYGCTGTDYYNNIELRKFYQKHRHLFTVNGYMPYGRIVLKEIT